MATETRLPPPAPEPVTEPTPAPAPVPVPTPVAKKVIVHRHLSPAKRWFFGLTMQDRSNVAAVCRSRHDEPCRGLVPRARQEAEIPEPPDPRETKVAQLPSDSVAAYCQEVLPPPSCETPLVVAFDGQPVDFVQANRDPFAFVPGEPAASDWPSEVTPWIALDLDGDGAITSGAELFGSSTVLATGGRAPNGFAALAALDANGDGTLDARDPMFSRLVLWSDRNGDHQSSPDELRPLAATVTAISLEFTRDARCTQRDDCEGERGTLHWRDAAGTDHVGTVVDVYLPSRR